MTGREIVDFILMGGLLDKDVFVNSSYHGDGSIVLKTENIALDADGADIYIGAEPVDAFIDRNS